MNYKFWTWKIQTEPKQEISETSSSYREYGGNNWTPIRTEYFDGEKNPGELGNPINLLPDHRGLRARAYEADLKSDVIKIITGKFFKWVVGTGLTIQVQPDETVLKSEGITEDFDGFREITEARFKLYARSKISDYSNMSNIHRRGREAYRTAFLGGDALVILRLINLNVKVQIIDGQEIVNPMFGHKYWKEAEERGNTICKGIEVGPNGEHVAFFIRVKGSDISVFEVERVVARSENTGNLMAWMIYGSKHRINHHRGVPAISAILEKAEKLDRYTEASVSGAEERANIVLAIKHSRFSTGENPIVGNIKKNLKISEIEDPYKIGAQLEKRIASTTSKATFNLPIGAEMVTLGQSQEVSYESFFQAVFVQLCAAVDVPPEVALQKYSSNYSASRAAQNGWGFIINIHRDDFAQDYYQNIYNLWLEVEALKNKIPSQGYLTALEEKNEMAIEAFRNCQFRGVNMPHIDPLKEVNAVRRMLGDKTKQEDTLISREQAVEILGQGDWNSNNTKYNKETSKVVTQKLETDVDSSQTES